jgi:hypothetical protein
VAFGDRETVFTAPAARLVVTLDRRFVLGGLFGLSTLGAAAMLAAVLGTALFAVTVAYLLSSLREELTRRRLPPWGASLVSTLMALLAVVVLALPLVVVVGIRLDAIIAFLSGLPPTITVELYGVSTTITFAETRTVVVAFGRRLAQGFALALPVLALIVFIVTVYRWFAGTGRRTTGNDLR